MANIGQISWTTPSYGTTRPYINVQDQKAQNTDGGGFTNGAWRTRDLNTIVADTHNLIRLAANQILLPAGTYQTMIKCPAFQVSSNQARLWNVSLGLMILPGTTSYTNVSASYAQVDSWIIGRFQLLREALIEVQHQCQSTQGTFGFGLKNNFTTEVYTVAQFWREA